MQDEKWLDARGLALQNIRVRGGRSFGIVALSALLALMLFLSSFWMLSLKNGLRSLSGRMGADLILVPEGYDSKISGAILRGEPNSFFFHTDVLEKIRENPAVEEAAPQLYLASLTAGCCSYPLQIIGLDFDSDFSVVPWLKASAKLPLAADEVLVGASVEGDYRHEIRLFGKTYRIKGKLAKTGMGFDTSVFMGMPEVRSLAREYEKLLNSPIGADDSLISSVMVKVKPGTDVDALRKSLQESWSGQGVYVLAAQNMMREVAGNVDRMLLYVYLLIGLIWLLGCLLLRLLYGILLRERCAEYRALYVLGARKRDIRRLVVWESLLLGASGASVGCLFALAVGMLFSPALQNALGLPYLTPAGIHTAPLFLAVLLIAGLLAPCSAVLSLRKQERAEYESRL